MQNVDALIVNLRTVGSTMIFLAVLHAAFAKRFHWGEELPGLLRTGKMFLRPCFFHCPGAFDAGSRLHIFFAPALCEKVHLGGRSICGNVHILADSSDFSAFCL